MVWSFYQIIWELQSHQSKQQVRQIWIEQSVNELPQTQNKTKQTPWEMVNISSYNDITQHWNNKLNLLGLISGCGHRASLSATSQISHTDYPCSLLCDSTDPQDVLCTRTHCCHTSPAQVGDLRSFACVPFQSLHTYPWSCCSYMPASLLPVHHHPLVTQHHGSDPGSNFSQSLLSAFPSRPASFLCDWAAEQLSIPRHNSSLSQVQTHHLALTQKSSSLATLQPPYLTRDQTEQKQAKIRNSSNKDKNRYLHQEISRIS